MTERTVLNLAAWSLQAGLVAIAAAALARLVKMDAPGARYVWWRAVLIACLALPVIQPWQAPAASSTDKVVLDQPTLPSNATTGSVPSADILSASVAIPAAPRWPSIVLTLLMIGAALRLGWVCAGLLRLRRMRRIGVRATRTDDDDLMQSLAEAGADVRQVDQLRQPVTFGVRRPVVLLPASLATMSSDVQRAVLAHELWHVKRRDWMWTVIEEMVRGLLWFHPATWYLVSRVQSAREEVVDELSVLSTNARRSYLEALLAFADEPAAYPAAPFVRRRQLFDRMMLISKERVMSPRRIVSSIAAMGGALVVAGWYGMLAFPLTGVATPAATESRAQGTQMPRDPRAGVPGPATSREQELKAAIDADPSQRAPWLDLARLQEERGAIVDAEATLRSGIAARSGDRHILLALASFLNRTGEFDKAIATLELAAAQNPGDPSGHQLVATYYWEKAQKDASLSPADKLMYLESGLRATDMALSQRADYVEALTYKNIMLRMKANLVTNAAQREQLLAEAETLRTRAMQLARQRPAANVNGDPAAPPPPPPPPPPSQYYEVDGQQAVRIGGNIPTPTKVQDVRPVYPPAAGDAGVSGTVIIELVLDTQGTVRRSRIVRSIPGLDEAALAAVRQWRFLPTTVDGVVVPVVMTVTMNFTLQ